MKKDLNAVLPGSIKNFLLALSLLALAGLAWGLKFQPERTWPDLLMAFVYLMGLGLGACLFIAIHFASSANWATSLRRVPEAMAQPALGLGALLLVAILGWGLQSIYPWATPGFMQVDPVLALKAKWLEPKFFSARLLIYLAAWLLVIRAIIRHSRKQDQDGLASHRASNVRLSYLFLGIFAATFPLASMDWIMSLEPRWFSSIFGIYSFAGTFQVGLAMMILLLLFLRHRDILPGLQTAHLHDMGKLLFAFSNFWAYMWFSQYMLIWYADQPDEITYYLHRSGGWFVLMMALIVMKFAVPLFGLISQPAKRSPKVLIAVCLIVLAGHWLDLAVMILPATTGKQPDFGVLEFLLPFGAIAAFLLLFFKSFASHAALPEKDLTLNESLHHH